MERCVVERERERGLVDKSWRDVLERSVVQKCWGREL